MRNILLVCTGNLCRSPMAAALLQARLEQDEQRLDWRVISAGVWAAEGRPASKHARTVMEKRGYNVEQHRSRQITRELVAEADLVLGMTPHHVEALRVAFPQLADRIHLLAGMVGRHYGVRDPYGQPYTSYREVADELERLIERGYERIVALAEKNDEH